ncbi:galactose ABC transporter substrate-binding protein [Clostridium sp. AF32-12BH]|uniref:galactose ABC transporter substrate-binding protein n=1 Tax=Clostridium sp. AF32-12BH TaxID=2292006 RepID=UPI000E5061B7|nr:galactose ABC transporter substrate-binding protein [Clostridium sp. AF32-12BH]RHP49041.1 galactose ABC transporter substrate-binding protein [Clostridium sp. AF32-12BH]
MNVNSKKTTAALLGLFLTSSLLSGCQTGNTPEKKNAIRIGVSLYRADDTFISNIRAELEKRAKAYEQETGIKVTLDIQDAKGNQYTQNKQVERFVSLGCDALCINPVDRTTSSGIIDPAMAADIPVVFFNRQPVEEDMDRWDKLYYVGADAKESAVLEAEIVAEQYEKDPAFLDKNGDGVISYVLLEGESNHQDSLIRTEWSVQTLKDRNVPIEKVTGGIANWERSQASAMMEQWLSSYPDKIELVISNNDDMALGAIDAMERAGANRIRVVGIDGTTPGLDAVKSGKMLGTVSSDKSGYADAIFTIAASAGLGEPIPEKISLNGEKYYWTRQNHVTKDNINP